MRHIFGVSIILHDYRGERGEKSIKGKEAGELNHRKPVAGLSKICFDFLLVGLLLNYTHYNTYNNNDHIVYCI